MVVEELDSMPALGPLLRRAAFGGAGNAVMLAFRPPPSSTASSAGPGDLGPELLVRGVRIDREQCARYDTVCGFTTADRLAPTYPHVLAFPLALDLMTRPSFPFPALGLVHLSNRMRQLRPLSIVESFEVWVRADNLREHERGRVVDLVSTVVADDIEVWSETSTYLHKRRGARSSGSAPVSPAPTARETWRVGTDVGPAYARVSGDRNPIHTSTLGARLFGFPRPIAHGMWSLARCLAAVDLPARCTVEAAFKLPILLPGTVAFSTVDSAFALHDAATGRPHLLGAVLPPDAGRS